MMDFIPGIDGPSEGVPRVLACFSNIGENGTWKFGSNVKTTTAGKQFIRKKSEPFASSLSRSASIQDRSFGNSSAEPNLNRMPNSSLSMLVHSILLEKKPVEVPNVST